MWTWKCNWIARRQLLSHVLSFVPGISVRNWTDEWLEEQNRKENTPNTFNGKEYTLYEAKQRQRQMETCMRAQREKVDL